MIKSSFVLSAAPVVLHGEDFSKQRVGLLRQLQRRGLSSRSEAQMIPGGDAFCTEHFISSHKAVWLTPVH